jgi:hypothetical protein
MHEKWYGCGEGKYRGAAGLLADALGEAKKLRFGRLKEA